MSEEYCETFEKHDFRRTMKEPMSTSAILYSIADVRSSPPFLVFPVHGDLHHPLSETHHPLSELVSLIGTSIMKELTEKA